MKYEFLKIWSKLDSTVQQQPVSNKPLYCKSHSIKSLKRLLFMTAFALLFVLCVAGVHTEGTILPVWPDRRLHGGDWRQRLLLPTARHPACAGYVLRHLGAQRTLTLPGQSVLCVHLPDIVCFCVRLYAHLVGRKQQTKQKTSTVYCTWQVCLLV